MRSVSVAHFGLLDTISNGKYLIEKLLNKTSLKKSGIQKNKILVIR
jgi:hypothetical protein